MRRTLVSGLLLIAGVAMVTNTYRQQPFIARGSDDAALWARHRAASQLAAALPRVRPPIGVHHGVTVLRRWR